MKTVRQVMQERLNAWMAIYTPLLEQMVLEHQDQYAYGKAQVPTVALRMRDAFASGSYNKDSLAIKKTCKALGIKYTYDGINTYLCGRQPEPTFTDLMSDLKRKART